MIIYLYGPDSYRRSRKLKELVGNYRKKYAQADLFIADLEENPEDWIKARDFLSQPSMFVDSKLTVIKESNIPDNKEWIKILKAEIKTPKNFLIISDTPPPKKDFDFLIKEPVKYQEFAELKGHLLEAFLKKEALSLRLDFSFSAWRFFCAYIDAQTDKSWFAINELEKIYLAKFKQPIALADLENLISFREQDKMYNLTGQILRLQDLGKNLGLLEEALLNRQGTAYVFNSLSYGARGKIALNLADLDIKIKSGQLDYEEALADFVLCDANIRMHANDTNKY